MKKEIELFDPKFVHFDLDESHIGKNVFIADTIVTLKRRVNGELPDINRWGPLKMSSTSEDYPFTVDVGDGANCIFYYYDPNYETKRAYYKEGKTIQYKVKGFVDWEDYTNQNPCWDDEDREWRINPEEEKPKRMTYHQLAEWLAKGNGEYKLGYEAVWMALSYDVSETDAEVSKECRIRRWNSDEWIEPTVDVYEEDCK